MRRNTLYKIVACVLTLTQTFYPVVGSLNTAYAASPFKNEAKDELLSKPVYGRSGGSLV